MKSRDNYHHMHHVTSKFASQYKTNLKPGLRFRDVLLFEDIADMFLIIVVLANVAFTGKYAYTLYTPTGYFDILCMIFAK